MKTIIKTLVFIAFISMNAQVEPILDHTWTIEKIVTEDETIMADTNSNGNYDNVQFSFADFSQTFYEFDVFLATLEFDDNAQTFEILELDHPIGLYGTDISIYFHLTFIKENQTNNFDNPFTYSFREESSLIYLDITNSADDVATFSANTLSNTNFDQTQFSIYPNPVTNQLHVESEQAQIERVQMYTLSGKQVLDLNFRKDQPIVVSSLAKGLYLIKIETQHGSLTKKLIKE